jgi:hypothetical protein
LSRETSGVFQRLLLSAFAFANVRDSSFSTSRAALPTMSQSPKDQTDEQPRMALPAPQTRQPARDLGQFPPSLQGILQWFAIAVAFLSRIAIILGSLSISLFLCVLLSLGSVCALSIRCQSQSVEFVTC